MSPRQLRLQLLGEILIYALICRFFCSGELGMPARAAIVLALALGVRALIIGVSYAFAARWPSPPPLHLRAATLEKIGAWFAEWLSLTLLSLFILPFERLWMGPDRLRPATDGRPPVLLIHGYLANRGFWYWLRQRLERHGWIVATISLQPVYSDIDAYVDQVTQRIDEVLAECRSSQLVLIGHSMGGLVSRAYLRRHGGGKVARLITLGSPHKGSRLATLGLGRNARQMEVGSAWLKQLEATDAAPFPPTVAVYSYGDNFVMPQESARLDHLPDARHVAVPSIGHIGMALSPEFGRTLIEVLEGTT